MNGYEHVQIFVVNTLTDLIQWVWSIELSWGVPVYLNGGFIYWQ